VLFLDLAHRFLESPARTTLTFNALLLGKSLLATLVLFRQLPLFAAALFSLSFDSSPLVIEPCLHFGARDFSVS
jgi:hypothetical protein